jgi:hypothetical protein
MINFEQTVISQYANSPALLQLIRGMNDCIDPRADIDAFFDMVWNVDTAQGFGLDIWGRIVDVGRVMQLPSDGAQFGFADGFYPFGSAPFRGEGSASTSAYVLGDNAYRTLIMVKALANISAATAPVINKLLRNLFKGRGNAYVVDLGGMSMRYVFGFYLKPYELAVLQQSDALPRPAGVSVSISNGATDKTLGFSRANGLYPFSEGTFHAA